MLLQKLLLLVLSFYKKGISPLLFPSCRFVPSCSDYAQLAIEHHGALKGFFMTAKRLFKCHPFSRGGWDPVKVPATPLRKST